MICHVPLYLYKSIRHGNAPLSSSSVVSYYTRYTSNENINIIYTYLGNVIALYPLYAMLYYAVSVVWYSRRLGVVVTCSRYGSTGFRFCARIYGRIYLQIVNLLIYIFVYLGMRAKKYLHTHLSIFNDRGIVKNNNR